MQILVCDAPDLCLVCNTDACAAGPERSGSTWLFNAVRLLLKSAQIPYDPYWITNLSQLKLQQRMSSTNIPTQASSLHRRDMIACMSCVVHHALLHAESMLQQEILQG